MHKKSSMRSVQAKLSLHGLESQLLISEKKRFSINTVSVMIVKKYSTLRPVIDDST